MIQQNRKQVFAPGMEGDMIAISLVIGFFGMMFGLVAALFAGIATVIGVAMTALFSTIVRTKD